ncbi:glyoxalase [Glutamicibacter uratoxydans]|uniref:Glyoxalase n=1 Tax=Glutamicibacter uratoxydans TaxID=43667 RepID=A0A4Y4DU87_GLUUR|nr:VOC family protein [Glutamicibacter uratoxydans]GED07165.1 glyoxalase [Glutamicibacter uratoxydans]
MEMENLPAKGITGNHATAGVPNGVTTLTPFLAVQGAAQALEFYTGVFGARVVDATELGGVVVHAEIDFGQGHLQIGEPSPDYGLVPPPAAPSACYSMGLYCQDVDAVLAKAVDSGATVREPAMNFVSGDRFASIIDPFGIRWTILSRIEDLSEEESARRVAQWAAEQ